MPLQRIPFRDIHPDSPAEALMDGFLSSEGACVLSDINPAPIHALYAVLPTFFASALKSRPFFKRDNAGYTTAKVKGYLREEFTVDSLQFFLDDEQKECWPLRDSSRVRVNPLLHRNFPGLDAAFLEVYGTYLHLTDSFGAPQAYLTGFHYFTGDVAEFPFRVIPHKDDAFVLAFFPIGEPLEAVIAEQEVCEVLRPDEALLLAPGVSHFVRNLDSHKERYSVVYAFSQHGI